MRIAPRGSAAGSTSTCTRSASPSPGGTANIQRNVIAERGLGACRATCYADRSKASEFRSLRRAAAAAGDGSAVPGERVSPDAPARDLRRRSGHDPALWKGMVEMGLAGLHVPEEYGGAGLELLDLALVAETLGYGGAPGSVPRSLAGGAGDRRSAAATRRREVAAAARDRRRCSARRAGRSGGWQPGRVGARRRARRSPGKEGTCPSPPDQAPIVIVVGTSRAAASLVEKERGPRGWRSRPIDGVDRTRRTRRRHFDGTPCELLPERRSGGERVRDAGLVLLAADAFGGAVAPRRDVRRVRQDARAVRRDDRPLPGAQAPARQHGARGRAARGSTGTRPTPSTTCRTRPSASAAIAKAHITDRFMQVARDAVEAHGGIGFTWECDVQIWRSPAARGRDRAVESLLRRRARRAQSSTSPARALADVAHPRALGLPPAHQPLAGRGWPCRRLGSGSCRAAARRAQVDASCCPIQDQLAALRGDLDVLAARARRRS